MARTSVTTAPLLDRRRAGVVLHPTSLPGPGIQGTLSREAYNFVDFLADAGVSIWQMLPIGPTHRDLSPYQSLSVHAGNPDLICLEDLVRREWVRPEDVAASNNRASVEAARVRAGNYFLSQLDYKPELAAEYRSFCENNQNWLDDYALFEALREYFDGLSWNQWPEELRSRKSSALLHARREHTLAIEQHRFEQFCFDRQWLDLRSYAREREVYFFGDIPIFVAYDSADVWANQNLFKLDSKGNPTSMAGVPPDYFSATGQHWGNPHYDWEEMQAQNFRWWRARMGSQLKRFDLIRLDHFRGLEAYWEIPAGSPDASYGQWVKAPGKALLNSLFREYKNLPLIAENLGLITPEVEQLREAFKLPGMAVLQFAFDGNSENPHLPHNHKAQDVIYTGTHDNDTTLGWYQGLSEAERAYLQDYCQSSAIPMPWLMIKVALASVSRLSVVPLQDFLALGSEHRMNTPGTMGENWTWRFSWDQVPEDLAARVRHWLQIYDRLAVGKKPDESLQSQASTIDQEVTTDGTQM